MRWIYLFESLRENSLFQTSANVSYKHLYWAVCESHVHSLPSIWYSVSCLQTRPHPLRSVTPVSILLYAPSLFPDLGHDASRYITIWKVVVNRRNMSRYGVQIVSYDAATMLLRLTTMILRFATFSVRFCYVHTTTRPRSATIYHDSPTTKHDCATICYKKNPKRPTKMSPVWFWLYRWRISHAYAMQ